MSKFCGSCGAPLKEGAGFCGSCGASAQQVAGGASVPATSGAISVSGATPVPAAPAYQPVAPVPTAAGAGAVAPPAKGSPWVKILVVLLVVFVACGALAVGVVIYIGHKVSQKAHEYSKEILGEQTAENAHPESLASRVSGIEAQAKEAGKSDGSSGYSGDACALLSKEEVSHAIGIPIVSTQKVENGCNYLALGTGADMAAKHAAAMMGAKGADKKTQGMFEQFAGGVLKDAPKDANDDTQNPDGTVAVFNFSIDGNNAEEQLRLNHKVLGGLGATAEQDLDGIGDEAFVEADSMMMVRKGDKLIRIMFMSCPCATNAIKPLAKELAGKL